MVPHSRWHWVVCPRTGQRPIILGGYSKAEAAKIAKRKRQEGYASAYILNAGPNGPSEQYRQEEQRQ